MRVYVTCIKAKRHCGLSNVGDVERNAIPRQFSSTRAALEHLADSEDRHHEHAHVLEHVGGRR